MHTSQKKGNEVNRYDKEKIQMKNPNIKRLK